MLDHDNIRHIYFVGAGGIGMAALERYFLSQGIMVGGYDRTPTELTDALQREGIRITFDESADAIPEEFRNPEDTLVVYTPAVPSSHEGLSWFRASGFEVVKRAAVLGMVTRRSRSLCFSGTHGKTTTSSMAAHILYNSPCGCNAFLGGVLRNYGTNFLLTPGTEYSVIEADEYDRSFHHLTPYVAVVTATDPDHLDIYGTPEAYRESFSKFTSLIRPDGHLLIHTGLEFTPTPPEGVSIHTYSRDEGDFHAANIRHADGRITFDFVTPERTVKDIELGVPVEINIENAVAAMAAIWLAGEFRDDAVRSAMGSFMGPKRRFEFHLRAASGQVIIDDYAHHPDELRQAILSVKALYPDKKLTVAFQPHLYTRTRDFAADFAAVLSMADEVLMLDIYPAREEPIEGVTSQMVLDAVTAPERSLVTREQLVERASSGRFELLLTAGAGDICNLLPTITSNLKKIGIN